MQRMLKRPENSLMFSKMRIYNGENLKESDPKAKSLHILSQNIYRRKQNTNSETSLNLI